MNININTRNMQRLAKEKEAERRRQQELTAKEDYIKKQLEAQQQRGPGYSPILERSRQEIAAGVTVPGYEGTRDIKTGELLAPFKFDPYAGEAVQALKEQAFSQGESPWAKMQLQKQGFEEAGARDQAAKAQAQALAQAQGNLMRTGGLGGGARTRMAMQGARDLARSQQDVARQGIGARLGIGAEDLQRKQDLLQRFGQAEMGAQEANIGQLTGDVNRRGLFDIERYKQQMSAYGAEKQAQAQRSAGGGKK